MWIQERQLNKIDRLEKVYRNIDKTRAEKERKAKNKRGQNSKRKQKKINEEMERETKKALSEALAAEKYENFRMITEEEKNIQNMYLEIVIDVMNIKIIHFQYWKKHQMEDIQFMKVQEILKEKYSYKKVIEIIIEVI